MKSLNIINKGEVMLRKGVATIPLHYGKAPKWLFERMTRLAGYILELMVIELCEDEILERLSDPYWFQAFGALLGFDWHSSGLTTTTCGAIKEALNARASELGIFVAGGKGSSSRKTPSEIESKSDIIGESRARELIYASRMVAKVDSAAIQDGFSIYHHTFIFTKSGSWCVIQQGMNEKSSLARRYHWKSEPGLSFTLEPHKAIVTPLFFENVLNLVAKESQHAQEIIKDLSKEKAEVVLKELNKLKSLNMPSRHHMVLLEDINPNKLERILLKTYLQKPQTFEELLAIEGVGEKTIRALALISELIYSVPPSWDDPARFSYAHGGKDGIPYPVDRKVYDKSIEILERAVKKAKLGQSSENQILRKINEFFVKEM